MSGYIIGNLHACEQASSVRSMCSSAVENICIIINSACIRTSLDLYFCLSLSLALNVRSSVRICYDSLYVHTRLLIVFDFLFLSGDL